VACYDGDQFNPNLLSEDRNAIGDVQNAIQKWASYDRVSRFLCRHNCYSHAPSSQRALLESDAQSVSFAFGIGDHDRSPTPRRVFFLL
jgi:hypothetical protein